MLLELEKNLLKKSNFTPKDNYEWVLVRASVLRAIAEIYQYNIASTKGLSMTFKFNWINFGATYFSILSILNYIFFSRKNHSLCFFSDHKNLNDYRNSNFLFNNVINLKNNSKVLIVSTFTKKIDSEENIEVLNIFIIRYFYYLIRLLSSVFSIFIKPKIFKKLILQLSNFKIGKKNSYKILKIIINTKMQSKFLSFFVLKILNNDHLKFFVFEDGFMSRNTSIIRKLNLNNIHTVELQHGAIYPGHEAYNAHPSIINKIMDFQMTPKIIWLFGDEWNKFCNLANKFSVLGVPWYNNIKQKYNKAIRNFRVLIISDGIDTSEYINLTQTLQLNLKQTKNKILKSVKVELRLHPSEQQNKSYKELRTSDNVDVWEDIYSSDIVIACVSTCLFQASFLNKRSIIWINNRSKYSYNNNYPFTKVEKFDELINEVKVYYLGKPNYKTSKVQYFSPLSIRKLLTEG